MKAMRDFYKAPIAYDTYRRGYYYEDPNFSINSFPQSPLNILQKNAKHCNLNIVNALHFLLMQGEADKSRFFW
jgi:hypothetical protein